MAFPVHLPVTGILDRRSMYGVKIGGCEPEGRIGGYRTAQSRDGKATVDGPLCLSVPRRCLPVCSDGTAVFLDSLPGVGPA
jgi:hypothetical protein